MARVSKRSKAVIDKNVKAAEAKAPVNAAEVKEAVEVKTEEVKEAAAAMAEEAVKMAKENAVNNHVDNVEFLAGDVERILDVLIKERNILPDVVMVDPPRKGLDKHSVENILKIRPKRMVYISCNPATLVRDLRLLEDEYLVEEIRPVDMFPFTRHVECVVLLSRK